MVVRIVLLLLLVITLPGQLVRAAADIHTAPGPDRFHRWIEQFKQSPRGPFESIQWFCHDGSVLPPKAYACRDHGGGFQHGVWNARAEMLRNNGYLIATLFSTIKPDTFTGKDADLQTLKQILLEQYLIHSDDGWIFRRARLYRGAIQAEAEQDSAGKLALAMMADPAWMTPERYLLLREAVRLLPLPNEPELSRKIRQAASDIAEQDSGFHDLRVKIHSLPDKRDAARVRDYARTTGQERLRNAYASLASDLDSLYSPQTTILKLRHLAGESRNRAFKLEIAKTIEALQQANSKAVALHAIAVKSIRFRNILLRKNRYTVYNRLRFLRASLLLEQHAYALGNQLVESSAGSSRATRIGWLRDMAGVLHATGLLSSRQWRAATTAIDALQRQHRPEARHYYNELRYLARISEWSQHALTFHFAKVVKRWQRLSPLTVNFIPDRLRSSPLLPFTRTLDTLIADAARLSGIRHTLFGKPVGTGMRALNPGMRRGILRLAADDHQPLHADSIYLLPGTRRELTPVAGIITRGEGSSLSHVQLLARNLGIPNMVVNRRLFNMLKAHLGERIVMRITARGMIVIERDAAKWNALFTQPGKARKPALAAMKTADLRNRRMLPLSQIRARDSGRTVGPKAANLGELKHYYPDKVNPGLVLPFGLFRQYLDQPMSAAGPSVFAWMQSEYQRLARIPDSAARQRETSRFLARLRQRIISGDPGQPFRQRLRRTLQKMFGAEGSYGLFVRSDTNMEDLPGFNGAGLNLTVPNVVGFDALISAILRVWASPFSERAFAWRQAYMQEPVQVYPSVLLMKSFASEKSGVLITADVDSGDRQWLTIASNEGVGGAVAGQLAEEIRVQRQRGVVKLLAQASAPEQAALNPAGGMRTVPASGREYVLNRQEITQLRRLASDVERRFPLPHGKDGAPVVADIEFGFRHGKLALFQIRPFVESRDAARSLALAKPDRQLPDNRHYLVRLDQPPTSENRLK